MAVERRNPLPVGRYWIDVIDTRARPGLRLRFAEWLGGNRSSVRVVRREQFGGLLTGAPRDWYLFEVMSPVTWPATAGFGYPSIARSETAPTAPEVRQASDTAQMPPPEPSMGQRLTDLMSGASTLGVIALGIYLLAQMRRK